MSDSPSDRSSGGTVRLDAGQPAPDDTPTGSMPVVTTTKRTPDRGAGRHAVSGPSDPAVDERGRLTIADTVVEKVAVAAASEVEHVGGSARRLLGVPAGRDDAEGRPRVAARVTGQVAALDIHLSVVYPTSVRATTEAVRRHVRDRVHALTEISVTRVDIAVTSLPMPSQAPQGRVIA